MPGVQGRVHQFDQDPVGGDKGSDFPEFTVLLYVTGPAKEMYRPASRLFVQSLCPPRTVDDTGGWKCCVFKNCFHILISITGSG